MITYRQSVEMLEENGIENALFDASLLFEKFAGIPSYQMRENADFPVENIALEEAIRKRCTHYPLQYLLGEWCFFRENYLVNEHCLIPRQDTEILVEKALELLPENAKFADLCTGSGCIAVSVLANRPDVTVSAVEIDEETLSLAVENAKRNGVANRFTPILSDVFQPTFPVSARFDAILCNPPYLTAKDMEHLQKEVQFEPAKALYGGKDGLDFYRYIVPYYERYLKENGFFLFEIGADEGNALREIALKNDFCCEILKDYAKNDRIAYLFRNK